MSLTIEGMSTPDLELTADEASELAAMREQLHADGYRDIAEHKGLRVGARIRHYGHQWSQAYREGTGFVAVLTEKPDSAWSVSWRAPDIELIAVWDKALSRPRLSQLAQYHVHVMEVPDGA